jgi:endonuclease-8
VPEGDTIFRAARTLHRALGGRAVTRFESVYPALTRVDDKSPLAGRTVDLVTSRGKHLLMAFSGGLILHTHMRMHGAWHIYRTGERWRSPRRDMRIVVGAEPWVAVGFNIPVAEFLTTQQLARHPVLQTLGPDLADPRFDRHEALRRIRSHPSEAVGDLLLNQRVVAGIGNVLKSELLFVAKIDPFAAAGSLDDAQLTRLIDAALGLMAMNVAELARIPPLTGRRTTRSLDPSAKLYVYGRGGRPCRVCRTPIAVRKTGTDARMTYWCARCQGAGS